MAYGKTAVNGPVPMIGAKQPDKEMMEKQIEAQATQAAFNVRTQAVNLAIAATNEAQDKPERRTGLIMSRAILFESFIRRGKDGVTFVEDEKPGNDETIPEKKD